MNFADLYKKIAQLDEAVFDVTGDQDDAPANECGDMPASGQPLMGEEGMGNAEQGGSGAGDECGGMVSMSSPKQSDSVTMNVSMNGSGAGGIRDLMDILRNLDDAGKDQGHDNMDKLFGSDKEVSFGEEAVNAPNEVTLDINAVTPTGDDLHSHAGNEVEKVNGGGNPYTNVDESLVSKLSSLYQEVKQR